MTTPYYEGDGVTLYHGDCLEITEWLVADVLVTDPPYGIAWAQHSLHGSDKSKRNDASQSIVGDESAYARDAALLQWGNRPAVVFGSWRIQRPSNVAHRLIWDKGGRHPGISTAPWFPTDEEIYVLGKGWTGKPSRTVIRTNEQRQGQSGLAGRLQHPTPKPGELMEQLIAKAPPGTIADPFAGSGSTLVAARNLGRRAIGVEIEERYCEIIARRLDQAVLPL